MSTLLYGLIRYKDARGDVREVEVTPAVADILQAVEPPLRERLLRQPDRLELVEARTGNPWDGPWYSFRHLIGEGVIWTGNPVRWDESLRRWVCRICDGLALREDAYCLACDRCGIELRIPGSPMPPAASRRTADGLLGGTGLRR